MRLDKGPPSEIAIDRAGMRAFLACLARRQLRQRGARSDIGAAPPAVDGRRVVRPGHGHRRSRIPVGRIETVAAAFELQNAQTRHALPREALAQAVGHRAKILADGLDAYARRVGGATGDAVRSALARLGRMIAWHGLDDGGKPYYWMGAGVDADEIDDYDEHWGESAYVVAMAWHWGGRTDASLRATADDLVAGLRTRGEAGQLRSFNWQCRSSVMAPYFLRE